MIKILSDTSSSITPQLAKELGIDLVSLFVRYDGEEHLERDMDIDAFYETLEDRIDDIPTSSQPSQNELDEYFTQAAIAGDEILGIFISSKLSGTFEGAIRAARVVKSNHLDFKCILIDSTSTGYDEASAVFDALEARDQGLSLVECAAAAENAIMSSRIMFIPETLEFLQKGGRIGKASALLGSMIQIVPILTVEDGIAQTFSKVRTSKRAIHTMIEAFVDDVKQHGLKRVVVHYIGKKNKKLDDLHKKITEIVGHDVDVIPVSPVIGSHVGPAVGIAYECVNNIEHKLNIVVEDMLFHV